MSSTLLVVLLASVLIVGASIAAMAVGVMMRRPCLRGSCGGPELRDARGESISCATCPNRRRGADGPRARDRLSGPEAPR